MDRESTGSLLSQGRRLDSGFRRNDDNKIYVQVKMNWSKKLY